MTMNSVALLFVYPSPLPTSTPKSPAIACTSFSGHDVVRRTTPPTRAVTRSVLTTSGKREETNGITNKARLHFPSLQPDTFRHPVDIRAARLVGSFIGAEPLIRLLYQAAEQRFVLENISTSIRVTSSQYPSLHSALQESCRILNVSTVPELYVRNHPIPNAYTLAVQSQDSFIVLHSSLIDLLTPAETQAVIAHELGHLKSEHGILLTFLNLVTLAVPNATLSAQLSKLLATWTKAAELSCDRAMLLATQDPHVAASALMKLAGGSTKYAPEMNVDEFVKQADRFDQVAKKGWLTRQLSEALVNAASHPLPVLRVRELQRWAASNHYRSIIRSGVPLTSPTTSE